MLSLESMIDQLLPTVLQMLRAMNNGDSGPPLVRTPVRLVLLPTPPSQQHLQCITDTIINNTTSPRVVSSYLSASSGGGEDSTAIIKS